MAKRQGKPAYPLPYTNYYLFWGCVGSILALALHSLADFNLHIPANGLLFFLLLGLMYRLLRIRKPVFRFSPASTTSSSVEGRPAVTNQTLSLRTRPLLFVLLLGPLLLYTTGVAHQLQADRDIRRARVHQQDLEEAAHRLARALSRFPADADTWIELGNIYQLMANPETSTPAQRVEALERAEAAYRRSVEAVPTNPTSHINLGWVRYQLDELQERPPRASVKGSFGLATRLAPFNYYGHYLMGHYLLHEGDREGAFQAYRQAIRANPYDDVIRAVIETVVERYPDYETLRQAIPDEVALAQLYLIGAIEEQPGSWEACKETFQRILALEPESTYYRNNYLNSCFARRDVDAAVEEVKSREKVLGKEPEVLLRLAEFLKHQGELDRALAVAEQVRDIAPGHPRATTLVGEIRVGQGNILEAVNAYEAHLKKSPRDPEAAFRLAEIYRNHGNRYKAAELYLQAAFLAPDQVRFQSRLADIYIQLGLEDKALEVLERCKKLDPNEVHFYVQSGRIHLQRNDWVEAGRDFGEALKRNPGHEEALRSFLRARAHTP